jgi:preprotein translocase subunit SecA
VSDFHPLDVRGLHPERPDTRTGRLDQAWAALRGRASRMRRVSRRSLARWLADVETAGRAIAELDAETMVARAAELGVELRRHGFERRLAVQGFAMTRELAGRHLGYRHHDSQLAGGWELVCGRLVEMETGEGKTLTATLPASLVALSGVPVHVVTVNDYLTERDAEQMRPIYESLGLSVGVVLEGMDPKSRQAAYACDVTYATNKQLAFDFLRDRMTFASRRGDLRLRFESVVSADARAGRLLMRGLGYALIDEADSVLIDEARTPLILSASQDGGEAALLFEQALELSRGLEGGVDYELRETESRVRLTARGRAEVERLGAPLGGLWRGRRRREELVGQALAARFLFRRDEHYLVRDGRIQVIDEYTGRVMADRAWGRGIQQLIEAKEGCEITGVREPLARVSYQRFFRRYLQLAGMTGTVAEVQGEIKATYGLASVRIPTHRPLVRRRLGERVYPSQAERWSAVADRVEALRAEGRPVLVGTRSVAAGDELSFVLGERGIDHQVLTARQDEDEAGIVARAGEPGRVTVATNMAGRGTDIPLGRGVAEAGGLAVILTERHDAGRVDRQLAGRCARQGDPGSFEALLALDDALLVTFAPRFLLRLAVAAGGAGERISQCVRRGVIAHAQRRAERVHRRMRKEVLRSDRQLADTLAFSGHSE